MNCASELALTALAEGLRRELVQQNSKIMVTVSMTRHETTSYFIFDMKLIASDLNATVVTVSVSVLGW
jgi:hypothetical protein